MLVAHCGNEQQYVNSPNGAIMAAVAGPFGKKGALRSAIDAYLLLLLQVSVQWRRHDLVREAAKVRN